MADRDEALKEVSGFLEREYGERALDPKVTLHPTRLARPKGGKRPGPEPLPELNLPLIDETDLGMRGLLGEGGMGVVHCASQRSLEREVAVKRLHEAERTSGTYIQALLEEARHTGFLEHPNIVPVYALGKDATGAPLMVMKKVDGVRWSELITDPKHSFWDDVRGEPRDHHVRLAIQLCRALEFAHARGVLHRDIKPDNVLIGEFGEVVLLDWGLAVKLDAIDQLPDGVCAGTPSYMAPEMILSELGQLGPAADVYLLGATLHHAITGRPPHSGDSVYAILGSVMSKDAPTYGGEVPEELGALLTRTMEPDPNARFEDAAALREALENYLEHRASVALADAAERELDAMRAELNGERDALRVRERFDAARFGFEQALRIWPEGAAARRNLIVGTRTMIRYHIEERNIDEARAGFARLEALEASSDKLSEGLRALEAELEAERLEQERLQKLGKDLDPAVSARERKAGLLALSAFAMTAGGGLMVAYAFSITPPRWMLMAVTAVLVSVSMLVFLVFRRFFFKNQINRMMTSVMMALLFGVLLNRTHGLLAGADVLEIISSDGIIAGAITGLGGRALNDRRLFVPAILLTTFGMLGAVFQSIGFLGLGAATVISVLYITFTERQTPDTEVAQSAQQRKPVE